MEKLVQISKDLAHKTSGLTFESPVTHVYNPLRYAWTPHRQYLEKYGVGTKDVLLVGMNPGPFGMAQTGVPFGDVKMVTSFLNICEAVDTPNKVHPKRPVDGFNCKRSEVSGTRVWSWARDRFGCADSFFERFWIANYCPLVFMGESGKNITPDKLPAEKREELFSICDDALFKTAKVINAKIVVGIGAFAAKRCQSATSSLGVRMGQILHPSPASPLANKGWAPQIEKQLADLGVL